MRAPLTLHVLFGALALAGVPSRAGAQCTDGVDPAALALVAEGDAVVAVSVDAAIAKYEAATHLAPQAHAIWWKLARTYEKAERWQPMAKACAAAAAAAERAEGARTHADYYFGQGHALEQVAASALGTWADARTPLETAIAIDPNLAEAYGELGWVSLHLDDDAGALQRWTTAIQKAPTEGRYYAWLADLYARLRKLDRAERVLREGISLVAPDDREVYTLHSLLGGVLEARGDAGGAVTEYEAAKAACAPDGCARHREAFFNVGKAYARTRPPRKNEATQNLQSFWKTTCKGASAQRFADTCAEAQEIVRRVGGSLQ